MRLIVSDSVSFKVASAAPFDVIGECPFSGSVFQELNGRNGSIVVGEPLWLTVR